MGGFNSRMSLGSSYVRTIVRGQASPWFEEYWPPLGSFGQAPVDGDLIYRGVGPVPAAQWRGHPSSPGHRHQSHQIGIPTRQLPLSRSREKVIRTDVSRSDGPP
jgi:hypothetical protein